MTRIPFRAVLTASVLATLTLAAPAEAGGMRLGFGGPMASFVATPSHGNSGGSQRYSAPSSYGRGAQCAKKRPSTQTASRHHVAPRHQVEPKVVHARPKPAHREKVQVATVHHEVSQPKARTRVVEKSVKSVERIEKVAKVKDAVTVATADTTTESSNGATGSLALAQTAVAATNAEAAVSAETAVTAQTAPAIETLPTVGVTAPVETAVILAQPEVALAQPEVVAEPAVKAEVPSKKIGCKKFIPSVGVTIDVACAK